MGLIRGGLGAFNGTMADQWKEVFYCDSLPDDVLAVRGRKKTSKRSSNTKGNDNVITNGSTIIVADGQAMVIVDQGKIVEFSAEPGEFTFQTNTEPSMFCGNLGDGLKNTFSVIGKRFTYGGDAPVDQRIYYFNLKELLENKFGTVNPIPFRVCDMKIGLDVDVSVRCSGVYTYKIVDPLLFYKNVCGNVEEAFTTYKIEKQLKNEFMSALNPAFGQLSDMGMRPNQIPTHTMELEDALNNVLNQRWVQKRGIAIESVAISSLTLPKEDQDMIKDLQKTSVFRDPGMAGATLVSAQADSMRNASSNANGAMHGFFGMGMATNNPGTSQIQGLYNMAQQQQQSQQQQMGGSQGYANQQPQQQPNYAGNADKASQWQCEKCGAINTGNFCQGCGTKRPEPKPANAEWFCQNCGTKNTGNFCQNCGTKK